MSASEEGGAPWRHVAGGPWLPIRGTANERVREGSHDTNRLISVRDRSHALRLARALELPSLSSFLASPGGERWNRGAHQHLSELRTTRTPTRRDGY